MFSLSANFRDLFKSTLPLLGSDIIHKAYLNIDEYGSESSSGLRQVVEYIPITLQRLGEFRADHPFVFAIRSKSAVYFAGHVATF